MTFTVKTN